MSPTSNTDLLERAQTHIKELEGEILRLTSPPHTMVTLQRVLDKDRVLVASRDGSVIVEVPEGRDTSKLYPGQLLTINGVGAIVDEFEQELAGGEATVKRVFTSDMMEIDGGVGTPVLIFKGAVASCVKPGDIVQLDRTGTVALKVVPKDRTEFSIETATGVSWDDIGGQDEAKQMLREAIEGSLKFSSLFKAYGVRPLKGVLLSGPPGCGKTLLAKATANAVREVHGAAESSTGFIYVKGPEVLNMWVGNSEAQVRGLFSRGREHKEKYGYPAVIFIDEADAILGKRGSHHGSVLASTIVPTFLAEMDGMEDSGSFVLLATNRQDILDPAIVRDGRIDRKVRVDRPQPKDAVQILSIHLGKTKVADDTNQLAGAAAAELFSEKYLLYKVGLKGHGVQQFHIRHLISGAMLAGVVDMAKSNAIKRDTASGVAKPKASGIKVEDITSAVAQVVAANRNLNHDDDLLMFAEQHGAEIEAVQRVAA